MDKLERGKFYLLQYGDQNYWAFIVGVLGQRILFLEWSEYTGKWVYSEPHDNNDFNTIVEIEDFSVLPIHTMVSKQKRLVVRCIMERAIEGF